MCSPSMTSSLLTSLSIDICGIVEPWSCTGFWPGCTRNRTSNSCWGWGWPTWLRLGNWALTCIWRCGWLWFPSWIFRMFGMQGPPPTGISCHFRWGGPCSPLCVAEILHLLAKHSSVGQFEEVFSKVWLWGRPQVSVHADVGHYPGLLPEL